METPSIQEKGHFFSQGKCPMAKDMKYKYLLKKDPAMFSP